MAKNKLRLIQAILKLKRTFQTNSDLEGEGTGPGAAGHRLFGPDVRIALRFILIEHGVVLQFAKHAVVNELVGTGVDGVKAHSAEGDGDARNLISFTLLFLRRR